MKKRYIVCVNKSTKNQDQKFIDYLHDADFDWWHYLSNTWLVTDSKGQSTVSEIRNNVQKSFDNEYNMVFQLNEDNDDWAGFGPRTEKRDMFKWIKKNW